MKKNNSTKLIVIGLIFGLICGQLLYDPLWTTAQLETEHKYFFIMSFFSFIGFSVFMGLLKMLILPLIATSVVVGITSIGDIKSLGRLGIYTLFYYFATMLLAVILGLLLVSIIKPGIGLQISEDIPTTTQNVLTDVTTKAEGGLFGVFKNLIDLMIPENIFTALNQGQTLSVIVFFIFFGVCLATLGPQNKPIIDFFNVLNNVIMKMVEVVLLLAPIGVFALLAWSIMRIGLNIFAGSMSVYIFTVCLGLIIHACITLPLTLWTFSKVNPFLFFMQMKDAIYTAIGTDSSSATLPVTMECATKNAGVSPKVAGLVLPLGATVNMDGTALYEAIAVVFLAQSVGIDLGLLQMGVIAITATLAAVGAAGIPSAGLVTMVIVVDATNQSLLSLNPQSATIPITAIGLILGVDRFLDMLRTAVNVWGDAIGAKLISSLESN